MRRFKRGQIWLCIFLLILLSAFSIRGAFAGAKNARLMFNSVLLAGFWLLLAGLLVVGILSFRTLRRRWGLLMVHLGCLMVLLGGMWGSSAARKLQKRYQGIDKIQRGYMPLFEGNSDNRVLSEDTGDVAGVLPFELFLKDFSLKYYWDDGKLVVQNRNGGQRTVDVEVGREYEFTGRAGQAGDAGQVNAGGGVEGNAKSVLRIKILQEFRNFKIDLKSHKAFDAGGGQVNPALAIEITGKDGKSVKKYVFRNFPERKFSDDGWRLVYKRDITGIKGYLSDVAVLRDGKVVKQQVIEVNKPMSYGGYNFFQMDYDKKNGRYTILQVACNSGLPVVFGGFALMVMGLFWWFWLVPVWQFFKVKR